MNIKQIIDIVLEANGGLNLYAKDVREKIISEITERVCLDDGYDGIFAKTECEKISKEVEERNKRIVAQHRGEDEQVIESVVKEVNSLSQPVKEEDKVDEKTKPKKPNRVSRKKSKGIKKFTHSRGNVV